MNKKTKCPKCGYEFSKAISKAIENKCPRCGAIINDCQGCSGNCLKCNVNKNNGSKNAV